MNRLHVQLIRRYIHSFLQLLRILAIVSDWKNQRTLSAKLSNFVKSSVQRVYESLYISALPLVVTPVEKRYEYVSRTPVVLPETGQGTSSSNTEDPIGQYGYLLKKLTMTQRQKVEEALEGHLAHDDEDVVECLKKIPAGPRRELTTAMKKAEAKRQGRYVVGKRRYDEL